MMSTLLAELSQLTFLIHGNTHVDTRWNLESQAEALFVAAGAESSAGIHIHRDVKRQSAFSP